MNIIKPLFCLLLVSFALNSSAQLSITSLNVARNTASSPYIYSTDLNVQNSTPTASGGFDIYYAFDVDNNATFSAGDSIIQTTIYGSIPANSTINISKVITTNTPPLSSNFVVMLLPTGSPLNCNCAMDEVQAPVLIDIQHDTLGSYVWLDANQDGVQDFYEKGIANVTVSVFDANTAAVIASTKTDAFGQYRFVDLGPGEYMLSFTQPAGYIYTTNTDVTGFNQLTTSDNSDVDVLTGFTQSIIWHVGDVTENIDAGFVVATGISSNISSYVWHDANLNGLQDIGEPGLSGVVVSLLNNAGSIIASTISTGEGKFTFNELVAGSYSLKVFAPQDYIPTTQTGMLTTTNNSDIASNFTTAVFTINTGETLDYIDAGLTKVNSNSIGDVVFYDLNQNGIQETEEMGVAHIVVELYDENVTTLLQTTTTDVLGQYSFENIMDGNYTVKFTYPSGFVGSIQNATADTKLDSDPNPATGLTSVIALNNNNKIKHIDAGIYNPINLYSVGDKVWFDANKNGLQDTDEMGVQGVVVTLYDASNIALATTTTNVNGNYQFNNISAGTYIIGISNIPNGYIATDKNTNTANGSDINENTLMSDPFTLSSTITNTIDAGLKPINTIVYNTLSIGDLVWIDANANGLQDASEVGASGVFVNLYLGDGVTWVANTVTDALGNYIFNNLPQDDYIVEFMFLPPGYNPTIQNADGQGILGSLNSDIDQATLRSNTVTLSNNQTVLSLDFGIVPSVSSATIGNFIWIDENQNGIQDVNELGVSGVSVILFDAADNPIATTATNDNGLYTFSGLASGTYKIKITNLPEGFQFTTQTINTTNGSDIDMTTGISNPIVVTSNTNNDIDAGIFNTSKAILINKVWFDANENGLQDATELPVPSVTVNLLDASNNIVASAISDVNGLSTFSNLTAGSYKMEFAQLPEGLDFTIKEIVASNNGSDVNSLSKQTDLFTLSGGQITTHVDAGLKPITISNIENSVWLDANVNGIIEPTESKMQNIIVTLKNEVGNILGVTTTNDAGNYSFNNISVNNYTLTFSGLPNGYSFTQKVGSLADVNNSDVNTQTGSTDLFTTTNGQANRTATAGIYFGIALPIQLQDFDVVLQSNDALLRWSTSFEENIKMYEILRSVDGASFTKVGEVTSKGNSNQLAFYNYTDVKVNELKVENIYYKLKIVNQDESYSFSTIKNIHLNTNNQVVNIYPIPAKDILNLDIQKEKPTMLANVIVHDMFGKVVKNISMGLLQGNNHIELNLNDCANGTYQLSIFEDGIQTHISKIVKQ